jgi:plasmid replication initiation protein
MKIISASNIIQKLDKLPNKISCNQIAIQHNYLVQAKYSMNLQQKRIMLWLTSQIKPDDIAFKEHKLSIKDLINICKLSGESAYKEIKKITFSLIEKGIRIIDITDTNKNREIQVSWLSSADYYNGQVKLSFSPKLQPYLLQLKNQFTTLNVSDLMSFKSIYAIRIYELLKQYQNIGERIIHINEIKEYCGIYNKLHQYDHFKQRVLLISQREINNKSDIQFEFEPMKESRKIVSIKFFISKNQDYYDRNKPTQTQFDFKRKPPVFDRLKEFGISKHMINTLIKQHYDDTIENALNAVDIQISKTVVRNPKAMVLSAIKDKWHPDKFIVR